MCCISRARRAPRDTACARVAIYLSRHVARTTPHYLQAEVSAPNYFAPSPNSSAQTNTSTTATATVTGPSPRRQRRRRTSSAVVASPRTHARTHARRTEAAQPAPSVAPRRAAPHRTQREDADRTQLSGPPSVTPPAYRRYDERRPMAGRTPGYPAPTRRPSRRPAGRAARPFHRRKRHRQQPPQQRSTSNDDSSSSSSGSDRTAACGARRSSDLSRAACGRTVLPLARSPAAPSARASALQPVRPMAVFLHGNGGADRDGATRAGSPPRRTGMLGNYCAVRPVSVAAACHAAAAAATHDQQPHR